MGYCACCWRVPPQTQLILPTRSLATHVALPPTCALGDFHLRKAHGFVLRKIDGPRPLGVWLRVLMRKLLALSPNRVIAQSNRYLRTLRNIFYRTKLPTNPLQVRVPIPRPPPLFPTGAKPSSPLPLPPYLPRVTMNLSEIASPPPLALSTMQPQQGPPFGRIRIPRKGRDPGALRSPVLPGGGVDMLPREQSLRRNSGHNSE